MKIIKTTLCALLVQSFTFAAVANEDCDVSHRWWMNLGLGAGGAVGGNQFAGPAAQLSFNGMITSNLFLTLENTVVGNTGHETDKWAQDVGLLLGYKSKHPNWYWSGAAGVAYYQVEREYIYRSWQSYNYTYTEKQNSAAIPVEAQIFWTPVKHFGIGLIGHGVVSKNPYAVAMLGIQIS